MQRVKYTLTFGNNELATDFSNALIRHKSIGDREINVNDNTITFFLPRNLVKSFELIRKVTHRNQYNATRIPMTTVSEYLS